MRCVAVTGQLARSVLLTLDSQAGQLTPRPNWVRKKRRELRQAGRAWLQ